MVRFRNFSVVLALAATMLAAGPAALAFEASTGSRGALPQVSVAELPKEARDTLALIRAGGPYPYAKDGTIFSNRERILPKQPRGYYHEYTVKTPGSRDRGARRVICGGKPPAACYYTDDHYSTFRLIRQ